MSNYPILTIITVTKNCSASILETLKSVYSVKNNNIQYLVIDGASTDGTLEKLKQFESVIDLLVSEPDSGIYDAMNKGVSLASGEFVLFLNGDDYLVCENFNLIIDSISKRNADMFCAKTMAFDINGSPVILVANKWLLPFVNSIPHPSSFVSRRLLVRHPFRTDFKIASDYDLFLRLFLSRRKIKLINIVSAVHNRGGMSCNVELSLVETKMIRREQLGNFFYLFVALKWLFSRLKSSLTEWRR